MQIFKNIAKSKSYIHTLISLATRLLLGSWDLVLYYIYINDLYTMKRYSIDRTYGYDRKIITRTRSSSRFHSTDFFLLLPTFTITIFYVQFFPLLPFLVPIYHSLTLTVASLSLLPSVYQSISLSFCLSVCLSVYQSVCLSVWLVAQFIP